jgi:hypothetical protein
MRDWQRSGGAPAHIRIDNGSEFIARILQKWLAAHQVKTR